MTFTSSKTSLFFVSIATCCHLEPAQVDTDKDGKISWSEVLDIFEGPEHVEQQYMEAFAECDKDDDLLISREELPTFFDKMHSILQEEDKKMGTKPSGKEDL